MQFNNFGANAVGTTLVAGSNPAGLNERGRSSVVERLFQQKLVAPHIWENTLLNTTMRMEAPAPAIRPPAFIFAMSANEFGYRSQFVQQ